MLNPLNGSRSLAQVLILCLIYAAVKFTRHAAGSTATLILAGVAILLLPASVAILGLERNPIKAANPVPWVRMVIALGPLSALALVVIAGYALLMALLARWALWLPLQVALSLFFTLSLFSTLGGALYERRHELDLETSIPPQKPRRHPPTRTTRLGRRRQSPRRQNPAHRFPHPFPHRSPTPRRDDARPPTRHVTHQKRTDAPPATRRPGAPLQPPQI